MERYDTIVIGAGQGGGPLAGALADTGQHVALIEHKHAGGTCVNVGCTPTKTMIASARIAYLARRASDFGVHAESVSVDLEKVRQRKRDIVEEFRADSRKGIEKHETLDFIEGKASFTADRELSVALNGGGDLALAADRVVINTGAEPIIPPIDGLDSVNYLDSTSIMELSEVPDHLIVLGGGYIGIEFGQMFRRFGSDVTIVERGDSLLAREDTDVADEVASILTDDGIDVRLHTEATVATQTGDAIKLELNGSSVEGSHLLVATGRKPSSDQLNLEAADIETTEKGFIKVNGRLKTSASRVYAIGDVAGSPPFTHISYDDHRILKDNLLSGTNRTRDDRIVPYTIFMDPELGRVGLTESQAREQGYDVSVAKLPMSAVARAREKDETRGLMKAVIDRKTAQILGATILGIHGGEVVSVIQMAMKGELSYTTVRDMPIVHPTVAESLNNLFSNVEK